MFTKQNSLQNSEMMYQQPQMQMTPPKSWNNTGWYDNTNRSQPMYPGHPQVSSITNIPVKKTAKDLSIQGNNS